MSIRLSNKLLIDIWCSHFVSVNPISGHGLFGSFVCMFDFWWWVRMCCQVPFRLSFKINVITMAVFHINAIQGSVNIAYCPCHVFKGSGYRCLKFGAQYLDGAIVSACQCCGIDRAEIITSIPNDLILWIDPGEASNT